MNRRPWKRLASLRALRRRGTELPPPPSEATPGPMPPLEPPDDREFVWVMTFETTVEPESA
jgi:hypothetical protein